jgi:hypothetical protein
MYSLPGVAGGRWQRTFTVWSNPVNACDRVAGKIYFIKFETTIVSNLCKKNLDSARPNYNSSLKLGLYVI